MQYESFERMFHTATNGKQPFPFQIKLAESEAFPQLIQIPTGAGKTAAVILAWLWRRRFGAEAVRNSTPRRLVYCLPMRVLVEQTRDNAIMWLRRLGLLGGTVEICDEDGGKHVEAYTPFWDDSKTPNGIVVTVLMGGEDSDKWDLYPERDAILIGTQDMLLSRALNRGYGMSRYRWPMHFGLVNNDCLWVIDEVQLMGNGLATTAQLQAFRQKMGTMLPTNSIWMSATLNPEWLKTVDFDPIIDKEQLLTLTPNDIDVPQLRKRLHALKTLRRANARIDDIRKIAEEISDAHQQGSRTLVVSNTVMRAVELHKTLSKKKLKATLVLVHSRFRPLDRKKVIDALLADPGPEGTIVISTQVIEAGIDVSAKTMFTELAPWPSLVQRFGRCNRFGEDTDARVFWIDVPTDEKKSLAPPYTDEELDVARAELERLEGKSVGPHSLPEVPMKSHLTQVVRCKDLVELFDTTSDLAGRDIDISRFIRETSDTDVQVFWRELPKEGPGRAETNPTRNELCTAPILDIRKLVKMNTDAWVWDALEGVWSQVNAATPIYPSITMMLRASDGRYTEAEGWNMESKVPVPIIPFESRPNADEYSTDQSLAADWMSISMHTDKVVAKATEIADAVRLPKPLFNNFLEAARWHDAGKAHKSFQAKIEPKMLSEQETVPVAKAPKDAWRSDRLPEQPQQGDLRRKFFRHELVSGLLALQSGKDDLVAYLAAAHHGKVRLSIRSMPDEYRPPSEGMRFARGVWDGDTVLGASLGGGVMLPTTTIDLSLMELGRGVSGPSWLSRMLALRDSSDLGPFRLAFLESLLKASDESASGGEG